MQTETICTKKVPVERVMKRMRKKKRMAKMKKTKMSYKMMKRELRNMVELNMMARMVCTLFHSK
jgi:hypothetical protein